MATPESLSVWPSAQRLMCLMHMEALLSPQTSRTRARYARTYTVTQPTASSLPPSRSHPLKAVHSVDVERAVPVASRSSLLLQQRHAQQSACLCWETELWYKMCVVSSSAVAQECMAIINTVLCTLGLEVVR